MNKYIEVIKEKIGGEIMNKLMFFCHENISSKSHDLDEVCGQFKGKNLKLSDVFNSK